MSTDALIGSIHGVRIYSRVAEWRPQSPGVLERLAQASVRGIRSLHVGQGDCTAVMGETDSGEMFPVLYIDLGGGSGKCAKTYPGHPEYAGSPSEIDLEADPKVLLTHWDKDHYFSATRMEAARKVEWLVPRQKVGVRCVKFVQKLDSVRCYPVSAPPVRFPLTSTVDLFIERVEAKIGGKLSEDKNLCGLAFTLIQQSDDGKDDTRMVLTGDAPYQYVGSLKEPSADPLQPDGTIACLFAFHHGSKTHLTKATRQVKLPLDDASHCIVFTYGLDAQNNNNFNHPAAEAVDYYKSKRWSYRVNTSSERPNSTNQLTQGHDFRRAGDRQIFFDHPVAGQARGEGGSDET